MTFTVWMAQVEELFQSDLGTSASTAGWEWQVIFEEGLTPDAAFEEYLSTVAR